MAALAEVADFASAQELHQALRASGQAVGLSTVYRTLQALTEAGECERLVGVDGEARYRRCSTGHHHHLVCRECGRTIEVRNDKVEAWAAQVAAHHGFAEVSHTLEVFGICPQCAGRGAFGEPG